MKKILLMAVAALMFVACNENGPSSSDKKVAKVVSSEAVDLIGQDMAKVDKALINAGYVKADEAKVQAAPARVRALVKKAAEAKNEIYVYGLPTDFANMDEDEAEECMTKALKGGKTIAMAYITNVDGKMEAMQTIMYMKMQSGSNSLFIDISNSLYGKIPEGAIQEQPTKLPYAMWYGAVAVGTEKDPTTMTDHAAYVAKISANDESAAQEMAQVYESQESGWAYEAMWINPNEETKKEMIEEIGEAVVYGVFMLGDMGYMNMYE